MLSKNELTTSPLLHLNAPLLNAFNRLLSRGFQIDVLVFDAFSEAFHNYIVSLPAMLPVADLPLNEYVCNNNNLHPPSCSGLTIRL
jgi:hypothetical protein